jgi:hypothetical protein
MTTVKLHINEPFYEEYLRLLFKCPEGPVTVKALPEIGRFIHSQAILSNNPKQSHGHQFITIRIPLAETKKENYFVYFDEYATQKINKAISFSFTLDFRQFCIAGRERGIRYNFIVNAFISLLNLKNSKDLYERLLKKDYRNRLEISKFLGEGLKLLQNHSQSFEYQYDK